MFIPLRARIRVRCSHRRIGEYCLGCLASDRESKNKRQRTKLDMTKVLIVEDDRALSRGIAEWLSDEHYQVEAVYDGREALERLAAYEYDAVILDWQLPESDGVEVCRQYRKNGGTTPILILTGKNTLVDKETGLDSGADDYITKPFEIRELAARMRALLRRPHTLNSPVLTSGDIKLDPVRRQVTKADGEVELQPMELNMLELFLRHPGQVFSVDALLSRVWTADAEPTYGSIYSCIKRLRRKLDDKGKPSIIKTLYGVGYSLRQDS